MIESQMALPLVARDRVLPITLAPDMPRFMRTRGRQIDGLIDLYCRADVFGGCGAEVGCYWGESSEIAAQFLGRLWCVDIWKSSDDEGRFRARMQRFSHVTALRMRSHEVAPMFADSSLDIVYIDAKHDEGNATRDFLAWLPKVKLGGWIAGHDYDNSPKHVGVVRAVDKLFGVPDLRFADDSFLHAKTPELCQRIRNIFNVDAKEE